MDNVRLTQATGGDKTKQHGVEGNPPSLHGISVESRVEVV